MEDVYWKELICMRTGLPLNGKGAEIAAIFIRYVIVMGNENHILSERDAKNDFANFTRKGTATHKAILAELEQEETAQKAHNPYRYEHVDPRTGERSYCGISIPRDAPPRTDEQAVWNETDRRWER
ncbi:MAG: hypothetical protein LBG18_02385 [Mediterranea sp.]|jgi:hypothetical protein|nr:hypothetical protein [Mediterranea sp.]